MSFYINGNKLLENYKTIWTKIEDLKKIESYGFPGYDDRYIKAETRTYGDKVYTNIRGLNVSEDGVECESFSIISLHHLQWFIICLCKKKIPENIFRQLCL